MKRLPILMLVLVLVAVATGCSDAHRYDQRLIAADSLMLSAPDSALALLTPICGDSLSTDGDRAYRDLLLTQARYKCYEKITADDDSAITRSMDYYRAHDGEQEKLTRTYLYKGAVMEELGRVDSAMLYYKTAEVAADEKDYANLAQITTRIANLYRIYYADKQICLDKYRQALKYYQFTGNKHMQQLCFYNMAMCASISKTEDPKKYIMQSLKLATELNDSSAILLSKEHLSRQLLMSDETVPQARVIAFECLNNYARCINPDLLLDIADIYVKEQKLDSATHYLGFVNEKTIDARTRVRKMLIQEKIAKQQGDIHMSNLYSNLCQQMTDSILNNKQKYLIQQIENTSNTALSQKRVQTVHAVTTRRLTLVVISFLALLAVVVILAYRRAHRYDQIIADFKQQSASQLNDLSLLKQNIENLKIQDDQLKSFISNHLNMTSEMIEACYHEPKSKMSDQVKKIVEFQHGNEDKWIQLFHYIDAEYNQVITKTRKAYPQLNDRDLLLIALTCMRFSQIQIAIILGYTNATSVSTTKLRLAQKMGLDCSLNDYIDGIIKN